jgi:hypothetical protein
MAEPQQTVILHFPLSRIPVIITRLTTYLLQKHYSFLQTYYDAGHVDFDIFNQQNQPLVRLTLQAGDGPDSSASLPDSTTFRLLPADTAHLLQHLLQTETSR